MRHKFFDKIYIPSPGAKISFSSGYSAFGDYSKAENAVLYSAVPWLDIYNKKIDKAGLARNLFPGIKMVKTEKAELFFSQIGGRKITVQGTSELIETASLPPVSEPVGAAGYDALVAAQSRALAAISRDLAQALRQVAQPAQSH